MNKYYPIGKYLEKTNREVISLSFEQIEDILGFSLPNSAFNHKAWWGNGGHIQAEAWMNYGYRTYSVNPQSGCINFKKEGTCTPSFNGPAIQRENNFKVRKKPSRIDKYKSFQHNAKCIEVCGYKFAFLQDINPKRDENGNIIEYAPQSKYNNTKGLPLNKHGSGSFCKFSIDAGEWPGVYLWVVDDELIYIGETENLSQRFNMGYGIIAPRKCFKGGQSTNCKMNKVVLELSKIGKTVKLYFLYTYENKQVELELLNPINTQYNAKHN